MSEPVAALAKELGFAACLLLEPDPFPHYERRRQDGALHINGAGLCADPRADYPWANVLLALLWPYRPYAEDVPLSGNYPSSNMAFHAASKLIAALGEAGVRAERVYVPVRELLVRSGIGIPLKNGLTAVVPLGTRFSVQTLAAALPGMPPYSRPAEAAPSQLCVSCTRCQIACPSGAISESGYDFHRCMRAYMGKEMMPEWVMARMTTMLGCEKCQSCCPYNQGIGTEPGDLPEAFALQKLMQSKLDGALAIVGKNQKSGGRIQAHAAVIAGNTGRTDLMPELKNLLDDPREAVRAAAQYAISRLHSDE